jgi:hypothetical protein
MLLDQRGQPSVEVPAKEDIHGWSGIDIPADATPVVPRAIRGELQEVFPALLRLGDDLRGLDFRCRFRFQWFHNGFYSYGYDLCHAASIAQQGLAFQG